MRRVAHRIHRWHEKPAVLLVVTVILAACTGTPPVPSPSASPTFATDAPPTTPPSRSPPPSPGSQSSASPPVGPSPVSTATAYIVQPGDSLLAIAARFGVSVSQILAANPGIADADDIRAGDSIVIPTPDAPHGLPRADGISDARADLVDLEDQATFAIGAVDLTGLGARLDPETVFIELLVGAPPPAASPDVEQIGYTVNIDTTGDGQPDFRLTASNAIDPDVDYAATLTDLTRDLTTPSDAFPGTFSIEGAALRFEVQRAVLGDPPRYAIAAAADRRFFPGGAGDPEVEAAIDYAPDQQWPRVNARWLEIGR